MLAQSLFDEIQLQEKIIYKKPPLPFQGNKRNAYNIIQTLIKQLKNSDNVKEHELIVVDVFGGSGLLADIFKKALPQAEVIWNDFDDYQKRLDNIETTNTIINLLPFEGVRSEARMPEEKKQEILRLCKEFESRGEWVDYLTLSSFILYGGHYVKNYKELEKEVFYYHTNKRVLTCEGYLEGVTRVRMGFRSLLEKFRENKNALLLLDPPYLYTMQAMYSPSYCFDDFLYLLRRMRKPYILFSSERSRILTFLSIFDVFFDTFKSRKISSYSLSLGGEEKDKRINIQRLLKDNEKGENYLLPENSKKEKNTDFVIYDF